ncbi:MAG TPA: phosphomannomutase, partial [Candidatus Paceibacterota bacterium]|nr:phosphomannomutase [Candidatus Paceibacterota bacterium]
MTPAIFKAYDIRGIYPDELDEATVYAIAQAYAKLFKPKRVVLGRDVRMSGPALWEAAARGLTDHGVDVADIGVITTDMMYFATAHYKVDGGLTISASHNPRQYNGLKMMRKGALPISGDSGIEEIKRLVLTGYKYVEKESGKIEKLDIRADYLKKCLSFVNVAKIKPLTVVVNGMFGPVVQNVRALDLPIMIVPLNDTPDGSFPKGPPDPLLEENRHETVAL